MMKFHPLPHEFGLRTNLVPAFFSAGWVAGWEIGNAVRMKSEALMRGEIPVTSSVSVKFAFVNGELVAVGGESRVSVVRPKGSQIQREGNLPIREKKKPAPYEPSAEKTPQIQPDNQPAELKFFQILLQVRNSENRDELIRNYLLYISGLISPQEFSRRLDRIKEKELIGNFISEFV